MDKSKLSSLLRKWKGLLVIVVAAVLLELLSGAQYYFTHRLMEGELEKRAESELALKAVLIKSNLNDAEEIMNNYLWKIQVHLDQPDSIYITMNRMVSNSLHVKGASMGFEPYYYPQIGRLFEVYSRRKDDGAIETEQIASPTHDYTKKYFYQTARKSKKGFWVEPYYDGEGPQATVTSFVQPVYDLHGKFAGMASVDVSPEWLRDTIDNHHIYPSSFILVLSENNTPVIVPSRERVSQQTIDYFYSLITDSTVERRKSSSGRSTVIHFDSDERDGTIFYANMKGRPHWKLAVVCYDDEVYASLKRLRVWFLLLMTLAFGILLYVVWRFMRSQRKMLKTSHLLHEKMLEEERMNGELRIANGIQQALMPTDEPTLKGVSEIEVEGRQIPAKAVGGDLYNLFVRDGKLFFCIGDVSGKGVPAAIIMAVMQTLFHNVALRESNPAHIMGHINKTACRNNKSNMFVTLFIGVLDLQTGQLHYCNAGHDIPILLGQQPALIGAKANLPVGVFSDFTYTMQEMAMQPGSTLFLYTDGLTEARNVGRQLFGMERIMQIMTECTGKRPKLIVETVISEVEQFSANTEQSDDLTLLAISYTPKRSARS